MPDEASTPTPARDEQHDHGEGPPGWMVALTLVFVGAIVVVYQQYLGDLAVALAGSVRAALPRALLAIGILLAGIVAAGLLRMALRHVLPVGRRRRTIGGLLRYGIYLVAAIAALSALAPAQLSGFVVGLGLVGFGVTLALQTPILCAVAWLTVNAQGLYAVGDRIRVGEVRGDVIHVGLLTTVLWEIEGELGRPTGRRVSFGNNQVLEQAVVNYTADLPYNWNQVDVPVAKEGDWDLARDILLRIADEVVGNERMAQRVRDYERAMAHHALWYDLPDHPTVTMKLADDNSYILMRLRYLAHLDEQSKTRTELVRRIFAEFRKHPRRLPVVYTRNQQQALDRHGMPANAWGPEDQEPPREGEEPVQAVPRDSS
ncbi:MAG: mechanosensitive ion channel family protein [Halobacteriales archaeon]|nr:mechanosensitive ion channel family protein [Halobacteriales archaeon]